MLTQALLPAQAQRLRVQPWSLVVKVMLSERHDCEPAYVRRQLGADAQACSWFRSPTIPLRLDGRSPDSWTCETMYDARNCVPIVDEENPFYCPSLPAQSFLASLRERLSVSQQDAHPQDLHGDAQDIGAFTPFEKVLDQSMSEDDVLNLVYRCPTLVRPSPEPEEDSSLDSIRSIPRHMRDNSTRRELKPPSIVSDTFSDLQGPVRHELSLQTVNEGSFQLSGKADRIQFFPPDPKCSAPTRRTRKPECIPAEGGLHAYVRDLNNKVNTLQGAFPIRPHRCDRGCLCFQRPFADDLFGPSIGTESPRGIKTLVARLDDLLPGIRLKEKLDALESATHQQIVDTLASDGEFSSVTLSPTPPLLSSLRLRELHGANGCDELTLRASRTCTGYTRLKATWTAASSIHSASPRSNASTSPHQRAMMQAASTSVPKIFCRVRSRHFDAPSDVSVERMRAVLGRPNSFLFLRELSLNGVQLSETDVLHIHHLPRLARLWLGSTGIGNEV